MCAAKVQRPKSAVQRSTQHLGASISPVEYRLQGSGLVAAGGRAAASTTSGGSFSFAGANQPAGAGKGYDTRVMQTVKEIERMTFR